MQVNSAVTEKVIAAKVPVEKWWFVAFESVAAEHALNRSQNGLKKSLGAES